MISDKYIASRIRELRKSRGMDVDKFGSKVGRSGKTVSAWETGRNVPSAEMLINICRAFSVEIGYFYPEDVSRVSYAAVSIQSDEDELIDIYRSLPDDGKKQLIVFARGCAASYIKEER